MLLKDLLSVIEEECYDNNNLFIEVKYDVLEVLKLLKRETFRYGDCNSNIVNIVAHFLL